MSATTTTIISIIIIFASTTLGSALVFFFKNKLSYKVSNVILGFASGIMIAAGIFGLLIPAIEEAEVSYASMAIIPVIFGFILGGLFLNLLDRLVPHFHMNQNKEEGIKSESMTRQIKFFLAVTIHNIPEGLAVGFACGLAIQTKEPAVCMSAFSLALGIAIQNFPEGAAISIPMLENHVSKGKAFTYGMLSGIVEPIFALIGILLVSTSIYIMPWLLAFAAGAMIFVTLDELMPSARKGGHSHYGLWAFMIGFCIMLALELLL